MAEPLQIPDDVTLDGLDGVPEALHGLFSETEDGKFALRAVPKTELSRFRDTNIQALKKNEELQAQIDRISEVLPDLDPEKAKEWRTQRDELQKKLDAQQVGKEPEELEKMVSKHTEKMRADFEAERKASEEALKKQREETQKWQRAFSKNKRETEITRAANAIEGFDKDSLQDALLLAERVWLEDEDNPNQLVARDSDGEPIFGSDGKKITPKEWLLSLKTMPPEEGGRPRWFHPTADGGGASGNNTRSTPGSMSPDAVAGMSMSEYRAARKAGKIGAAAS